MLLAVPRSAAVAQAGRFDLDQTGKVRTPHTKRSGGQANLDSIMAGWADDAVMMAPGLPPLEGNAAIGQHVEAAMQLPGFSIRWEPQSVHLARSGDLAYMIERNVSTVADSAGNVITTHGKVVTVWRKDETGAWKNVIDMWNEAPPPGS